MESPNLNKPMFQVCPEYANSVRNGECITCDSKITNEGFSDEISIKEYGISGMCQECQDSVFNNPTKITS